VEDVMQMLLRS